MYIICKKAAAPHQMVFLHGWTIGRNALARKLPSATELIARMVFWLVLMMVLMFNWTTLMMTIGI